MSAQGQMSVAMNVMKFLNAIRPLERNVQCHKYAATVGLCSNQYSLSAMRKTTRYYSPASAQTQSRVRFAQECTTTAQSLLLVEQFLARRHVIKSTPLQLIRRDLSVHESLEIRIVCTVTHFLADQVFHVHTTLIL
eukprot:m.604640 g.604640  ORF g.604640 m.604640 type:complete len:136 (-) comp22461_c0_seq6:563-970(-)